MNKQVVLMSLLCLLLVGTSIVNACPVPGTDPYDGKPPDVASSWSPKYRHITKLLGPMVYWNGGQWVYNNPVVYQEAVGGEIIIWIIYMPVEGYQ